MGKEEHAKAVEEVRRQLDQERSSLHDDHTKTREEHAKMVNDTRKQLEDERNMNAKELDSHRAAHIEGERNAGVLEGQVQTLSAEASMLRDRIAELQETIREAETRCGHENQQGERLQRELEQARIEHAEVQANGEARLQSHADECEKSFNDKFMRPPDAPKPKCGCILQ